MPEPTPASANLQLSATKRFANTAKDTVHSPSRDETASCSGSEDMDSELRIVDVPPTDFRATNEVETDRASAGDDESSPQDLRVLRPGSAVPITLATSTPVLSSPRPGEAKVGGSELRSPPAPPVGASRKRKNTTPTQDRRAKWLFGEASPSLVPPPPPLSPAVNGHARPAEENGELQMGPSFMPIISSGAPTPTSSPAHNLGHASSAPPSVPEADTAPEASEEAEDPPGLVDDELSDLLGKLDRYEGQLRQEMVSAVDQFCQRVKDSVRQSVNNYQSRNLATLSAAAAAAAAANPPAPPLPQLADINGNPALFNFKEVSKNVEQLMLASQCLPYRFMAAAAAANASGRLPPAQMPYPPPISGPGGAPGILGPLLPPPAASHMSLGFSLPPSNCGSPNGTGVDSDEADGDSMPLNMSKKKRTKVTDNHLRNFAGLDVSAVLPTALENIGVFNNINVSAPAAPPMTPTPSVSLTSSPLRGPSTSFTDLSSTTLTPVHLRKAKLMFFYTRYPNSNVLKVYFPDVKFNKHNTAQIVKWFSNFREFYYIQIEKFARQAIAEGVQEADEMPIVGDCELIRTLNTHYNRNNQIPVPSHFITVVEVTVREFLKALVSHKDQDHSWKKPIYKVIARYDQPVPDDFKNSKWIDHLDT